MQYSGGLSEVQWGGGAIMQYSGGFKYGGGLSCSTVEGYLQYGRGGGVITQYSGGLSCSTVEGASTVEGYLAVQWMAIFQYRGGCEVKWRL